MGPSMARKPAKKSSRKPPSLSAVLWLLTAANVCAGLMFSPITAASAVRVVGAEEADRARITTHLQSLRYVPCLRSNRARVETLIQAGETVDRADFSQNLFGRGLLQIESRQAVARLDTARPYCLDETGVLFQGEGGSDLPLVKIQGMAKAPNASFADAWEPGAVARLSKSLGGILAKARWTIEVDGLGVLSLYESKGGRIVLGSSDDMDEKLQQVKKIMDETPDLLARVERIDLTSPKAPVYVPRTPRS